MIFVGRDSRGGRALVNIRVGLFFLAAGLWLAGVIVGNRTVTGVAIWVAALALLVGAASRRLAEKGSAREEEAEA